MVKGQEEKRKSYKEWYSCDGLITDRHDGREMEGHPMASAGYISVLNPNSEEVADVTITFYHQSVEPTSICIKVPILGMEVVEVHNVKEAGERNKYYGLKVFASLTDDFVLHRGYSHFLP